MAARSPLGSQGCVGHPGALGKEKAQHGLQNPADSIVFLFLYFLNILVTFLIDETKFQHLRLKEEGKGELVEISVHS